VRRGKQVEQLREEAARNGSAVRGVGIVGVVQLPLGDELNGQRAEALLSAKRVARARCLRLTERTQPVAAEHGRSAHLDGSRGGLRAACTRRAQQRRGRRRAKPCSRGRLDEIHASERRVGQERGESERGR